MTLTRRATLGLIAVTPLLAAPALAMTPRIYAEGGIAIDGSDPVAYFDGNGPVPGDPALTHDWQGATWRFATEANRAAFAATPERFAPQYGGWCAWAVSRNYTASTIPEAWTLEGGKLYLNFNRRIQRRFERDLAGNIAKADANWPAVLTA